MLLGRLPANTGPPFRGASAKLPQTFREVRRLFWPSWLLLASALRVSVTFLVRSNTFSSTGIVSPSFSMHALKHLVVYQPPSFRKPSANKYLPRACFRACGAAHIFNNNVPLPTKLACGQKHRRSNGRPGGSSFLKAWLQAMCRANLAAALTLRSQCHGHSNPSPSSLNVPIRQDVPSTGANSVHSASSQVMHS